VATGAATLLAQQSQRFGFRSNHGNHPEFVSFSFGGTNNIGNAKDFRQFLQALNYQNDIFLEHGAVRWKGASSARAAGLSANENHSKPRP
jgi:hypothetical protein